MNTFETGRTYFTTSAFDHNCVYSITVTARTAKTLRVTCEDGQSKTLRVSVYRDVEQVSPKGRYSFAPIIDATDVTRPVRDWER